MHYDLGLAAGLGHQPATIVTFTHLTTLVFATKARPAHKVSLGYNASIQEQRLILQPKHGELLQCPDGFQIMRI